MREPGANQGAGGRERARQRLREADDRGRCEGGDARRAEHDGDGARAGPDGMAIEEAKALRDAEPECAKAKRGELPRGQSPGGKQGAGDAKAGAEGESRAAAEKPGQE